MVVSKQVIIKKMINELQVAAQEQNEEDVHQTIASVRLLCDLILEDEPSKVATEDRKQSITDEELKAMLGKSEKRAEDVKQRHQDDANGDSIFDF